MDIGKKLSTVQRHAKAIRQEYLYGDYEEVKTMICQSESAQPGYNEELYCGPFSLCARTEKNQQGNYWA